MEEDDWDAVIDVHLKGHYNCTRPFAQYIRDSNRQGCRIICFSSVSGLYGNFGQSNYGAAKAGIAGFARVLALELAKYGCTVNTISPGASTRMTIALREARGAKVDVDAPDQSPRQIAPVVTWLCSDAGQDMTSQIWDVMQGWVGIMQQPAVIKSFTKDGHWTLRDLDTVMPSLMRGQAPARRAHQEGRRARADRGVAPGRTIGGGAPSAPRTRSERLNVTPARERAGRVAVGAHGAGGGVGDPYRELHVRQRAVEHPEVVVDRTSVEHLDEEWCSPD